MVKQLLEVERLVRAMLRDPLFVEAECNGECSGNQRCGHRATHLATCPKCNDVFDVTYTCDAEVECGQHCGNSFDVHVDTHEAYRDLVLALVQLDMARERLRPSIQNKGEQQL